MSEAGAGPNSGLMAGQAIIMQTLKEGFTSLVKQQQDILNKINKMEKDVVTRMEEIARQTNQKIGAIWVIESLIKN